jgi:hypothetical protein
MHNLLKHRAKVFVFFEAVVEGRDEAQDLRSRFAFVVCDAELHVEVREEVNEEHNILLVGAEFELRLRARATAHPRPATEFGQRQDRGVEDLELCVALDAGTHSRKKIITVSLVLVDGSSNYGQTEGPCGDRLDQDVASAVLDYIFSRAFFCGLR